MELIENTALQLKKDFPVYTFLIYRGLFEKYIAVEVHGKVAFTIWVDKSTGYKELLDETYFSRVWWKRRFKTRLFHWSKQRRLGWGSYPEKIMERLEINVPERRLIRDRLELALQQMHIV